MTDLDKVLELLNNLTIKQEQLAQEARPLYLSYLTGQAYLPLVHSSRIIPAHAPHNITMILRHIIRHLHLH